jgi:regulator of ribonuclease activity A
MQSTCDLSDAHGDAIRVLPPVLRHFGGHRRFHGLVQTIKCFEDNTRLKEQANTRGDGRVLVVDAGGSLRCALLGDTIATEAIEHGWAGIVLYGCVRDTAELARLDLGAMALDAIPRRSLKLGEGVVGVPVEIAGIACVPGDLLVADEDGVVLLQPSLLAE